ncbi:MAG: hypothetical protein D6720_07150 [Gammaproteobacteria bacterium]|nr:MAG: hypothetical protein D6720_07150 [Gammaproteobacteria bacterium]
MEDCGNYWELAEYIPVDVAIDYWCEQTSRDCQQAKTAALLAALESGEVEYQRTDGKDFPDPVHQLYARNILVVHRESFITWALSVSQPAEKARIATKAEAIPPHGRKNYHRLILALASMAGLSLDQHMKAAEAVLRHAETEGLPHPDKAETWGKMLKHAKETD